VNAPKTGPLTFVNYEDICYSGGDLRAPQYYLIHQSAWYVTVNKYGINMQWNPCLLNYWGGGGYFYTGV